MPESPPLFYVTEPRFGCSQPVRAGDLLRVKSAGYSWKLEGMPFLVLGLGRSLMYNSDYALVPDEAIGIIDGEITILRIEDLEVIECGS